MYRQHTALFRLDLEQIRGNLNSYPAVLKSCPRFISCR